MITITSPTLSTADAKLTPAQTVTADYTQKLSTKQLKCVFTAKTEYIYIQSWTYIHSREHLLKKQMKIKPKRPVDKYKTVNLQQSSTHLFLYDNHLKSTLELWFKLSFDCKLYVIPEHISSTGIFVAITNNIFPLCQKSLDIKIMFHEDIL